jgi:uncharacterized protein YjdB
MIGDNQNFTASPQDQYGDPISAPVTWSSNNTTVGTVDPLTGNFTAYAVGTTMVNASNGSVTGTSVVTIETQI